MSLFSIIAKPPIFHVLDFIDSATDNNKESPTVVKKDEIATITKLIEDARKQGVKEIEIELSHELGSHSSAKGGVPIEGIPLDVSAKVEKNNNGKYTMKVEFLPDNGVDSINKWKKLYDDGAITEKEFIQAKEKIINKI